MSQDNAQYGDKTGRYAFDNKGRETAEPVADKTRVPFHPLDGILFATHHEGTHNVNTEQNLAAWHERAAVHRALGDDRSEVDVANHIRTIQFLADKHPELLGAAWKRYGNAAKHLPQLVRGSADPATIYSSKQGSRPHGPRMDALTDLVRPLVGVANALLVKAGKAQPTGQKFEPFDAHDPADTPEKLPVPKKAIDEPIAKVDARKTVKAGKDKEKVEAKANEQPTIDSEQPAIPLAPGPNERGGRFATIHAMVRDGHPKESVIAALQKEPHGLTATQASATFRRWLRSESARRMIEQEQRESEAHGARGHLKLARASEPVGGEEHDQLNRATRERGADRNTLAPLADYLYEHDSPNAPLIHAAADRSDHNTHTPFTNVGKAVWDAGDLGVYMSHPSLVGDALHLPDPAIRPPTTDDYLRGAGPVSPQQAATRWSSHLYQPVDHGGGKYSIRIVHRDNAHNPRASRYGLPADYRNGEALSVPVTSRADVHRLTERLHPAIQTYLQHWFARYGLPASDPVEGPHKLARPAGDKPVALDEMTKSGIIGGTALEYHLKHLVKNGDAAVSNAARAALKLDRDRDLRGARDLMNVQDPYAYLGRLLKDRGHKLAGAYNWSSMKDSLERDRMVEKMFAGTRAKFSGGDHAFWDKMTRQMNDPKKAAVWDQVLSRLGAGHTKEQVAASIHRIADRHLDREYLAAVKEDVAARTRADKAVKQTPMLPAAQSASEEANAERDALTGPGSELHWRKVTGRLPAKAPLRFSRAWGNES